MEADWTAFYRRYARPRFADDARGRASLGHTLALAPAARPYGLVLVTCVRARGLGRPPAGAPTARWWRGGGRWSLAHLWAGLRAELRDLWEFRPV